MGEQSAEDRARTKAVGEQRRGTLAGESRVVQIPQRVQPGQGGILLPGRKTAALQGESQFVTAARASRK
jgi:hypothetical protein